MNASTIQSGHKPTVQESYCIASKDATVQECLRIASIDAASALSLNCVLSNCSEIVSLDAPGIGTLRSAIGDDLLIAVRKDVTEAVTLKNMIINHLSFVSKDIINEFTQDKNAVNEYTGTVVKNYKISDNDCQNTEDDVLTSVIWVNASTAGDCFLQDFSGNETQIFSVDASLKSGTPNDGQNIFPNIPVEYLNVATHKENCSFVEFKVCEPMTLERPLSVSTNETKREYRDIVTNDMTFASIVRMGDVKKNTATECVNIFSKNILAQVPVKKDDVNYYHKVPPQNTIETSCENTVAVAEGLRSLDIVASEPVKMKKKDAEYRIIKSKKTAESLPVKMSKKAVTECSVVNSNETTMSEIVKMKKKVVAECPIINSKETTVPKPVKTKKKAVAECPIISQRETTVRVSVKKKSVSESLQIKPREIKVPEPVKIKKKTVTESVVIRQKNTPVPETVDKILAVVECSNVEPKVPVPIVPESINNMLNDSTMDSAAPKLCELVKIKKKKVTESVNIRQKNTPVPESVNKKSSVTVVECFNANQKVPITTVPKSENNISNDSAMNTAAPKLSELVKIKKKTVTESVNIRPKNIPVPELVNTISAVVECSNVEPKVPVNTVPESVNNIPNDSAMDVAAPELSVITPGVTDTTVATCSPDLDDPNIKYINVHVVLEGSVVPPNYKLLTQKVLNRVVGNDRKFKSREIARKRKSKWNTDYEVTIPLSSNVSSSTGTISQDTTVNDPYLKLAKVENQSEYEKRQEMLSWIEKKTASNVALSKLQQSLSKNALDQLKMERRPVQTTADQADQRKMERHSVHAKLAIENTKTFTVPTEHTLIKRSTSLTSAVKATKNDSIYTSATGVKRVKSLDTVSGKQNQSSILTKSLLVPFNDVNNDSVSGDSERSSLAESISSESIHSKSLQLSSKSVVSQIDIGSLATAVVPYTKFNKDPITEFVAKSERKDSYEYLPFDEYSLQGVKGKKGPIYRGPPSSQMTKRKYLTSDNDNEKTSRKNMTSHRKSQETIKSKYSVCESESGGPPQSKESGSTQSKDCKPPTMRTGKDGIGYIPEFAGVGKGKFHINESQRGSRAAKKRYINQCYLASVKAMEKAEKMKTCVESSSRE